MFCIKRAESPKLVRNMLLYARMLFILLFVGNFGPLFSIEEELGGRRLEDSDDEGGD